MSKNTTKMAISYAFKELLLEKPINKITVQDITNRCGINRQTFYYHFLDIIDMAEWICNEDVSKVLKQEVTYENWQESVLAIFELLQKEKPFIMNIYYHAPQKILYQFLHQTTYEILMRIIQEKSANIKVQQEDCDFIANFYKYGFVGLLFDWIGNDMKEDPKNIIARLDALLRGSFEQALTKANTK